MKSTFKTSINYKDISQIAWPIIAGSLAQTLLGFTDTAFLGRVGEIELGAAAIAGLIYFAIFMLGFGYGQGMQIMVARRIGEEKYTEAGKTIVHGFYFLFILGVALVLLIDAFGRDTLALMLNSTRIHQASHDYIFIRMWGIMFSFVHIALRAFFVGVGRTRIITWTTIIMAVVNIILDYLLIFGKMGFPEMGIKGAALASVLAELISMLFFIAYTFKTVDVKKYQLFSFNNFSLELFVRVFKTSSSTMLQNFVSMTSWLTFFFFVEKLGELELAVSNVIRNIYHIMLLPIWGHSAAVNSLVSNLIGQKRQDEIFGVVLKASVISTFMVIVFASIVLLFPIQSISLITLENEIIVKAIPILIIIAVGALLLSISFNIFSAISGTGRTFEALIIECSVLTIYMVYTWYMCIVLRTEVHIVWTSEIVYAVLLGIVSYLYLASNKWKGKKI
jgi:putative MATE family efflux protein